MAVAAPSKAITWLVALFTALVLLGSLLLLPGSDAASGLPPLAEPKLPTDFSLPDLGGKYQRLSDLRGKVVMVNFWATWCPPCRNEMPSMERAWQALGTDKFALLAVNVGDEAGKVQPFAKAQQLTFPILLDKRSSVSKSWQVKGLPTTFLLDAEGRIRYQVVGGRAWDNPEILKLIRSLAK